MIVKHNLYINPKLTVTYITSQGEANMINGTLVIKGLNGTSYYYLNEDYVLNYGDRYIIGFIGNLNGNVQIYKGDKYQGLITRGQIHYREFVHTPKTNKLHMRGSNTDLTIKQIFITDDIPDIVIPNKKDFTEDKQPLLPPEGDYKEIQPQ